MNCPQCGTSVADGTSICPSCDFILDASFLSADPPEADDATPARPAPSPVASSRPRPQGPPPRPGTAKRPAGSSGSRPAVKRPSTGARPATARPAAAAAKNDSTVIKSVEEVEAERPARAAPAARSAPRSASVPQRTYSSDEVSLSGRSNSGSGMVAPEAAFNEAKDFVSGLATSDKLAFLGAGVTILMCFFPWKETATDGEILGLMSLGFIAFIVNLLGMGAVFVRVKRAMPQLPAVVPWLVQLGAFVFGLLWCLVYMKISSDARQVQALIGNETVAISRPAFGVYIALLMQLVALGGTLMGLKEKPS